MSTGLWIFLSVIFLCVWFTVLFVIILIVYENKENPKTKIEEKDFDKYIL